MDEQKITPKKSEAGIEYIREMRLAGLIKRDIIPADEAVGYEELEKNGSLPDGVYATYENGKRSYCRVESTVPDMTGEEIDRLIQLRKASDLRTIKNWILFFGVMASSDSASEGFLCSCADKTVIFHVTKQ